VRRFLFDTGIFLYAIGSEHPYRQPCQAILRELQTGRLAGEASIELIHEFAYVRARRDPRATAAHLAGRIGRSCPLHAVDLADIDCAFDLWCKHERLDMRDAIFAAQALNRGIDAILSADKGYDEIPGLQRIDPADAEAVATLR
jgi:uncharacterized protein